jgi:hypothetical protein
MLLADQFTYSNEPAHRSRTILGTSQLNQDLLGFLLGFGYDPDHLGFVESLDHVVPPGGAGVEVADRATSHDWSRYYTAELEEFVRKRDRLIFSLFPEFDATPEHAS